MKPKCNNGESEVSLRYDGWASPALVNFIVSSGAAAAAALVRSHNQRHKCKFESGGAPSVFPFKRFDHFKATETRRRPDACAAAAIAAILCGSQEAPLRRLFIYEVISLWTISSWEINSRSRVLRR